MSTRTRRRFLAAATTSAFAAGCTRGARSTPNKPINLLFLMTDQHHHGVLGCAGNPLVKTPNLDRLAAQGARFTHATCPVPFCSPTRAAIVTGRYPSTLGLWRNIQGRDDPLRLREPFRTYLHHLAARGYRCHQLGKWHLGNVHELSCFAEGRQDVDAPQQMLVQRRQAAGRAKLDPGPRANEALVGNVFMTKAIAARHRVWRDEKRRSKQDLSIIGRSQMKPEFHYESVLADCCVQLLRRHRDEPFAITYSVSPPHALWVAPARFYDLYDPAAFTLPKSWQDWPAPYRQSQPARMGKLLGEECLREYLRCYYAQVTMVDWCVGRILDELERLGLADRTLVIFTSDHGDMQAAHGMMGKSTPAYYDEILRVPLLMRLPGAIAAGTVCEALASSPDLPATILDLLGAEPLPGAHGASLRPALAGKGGATDAVFAERGAPGQRSCSRMVRTRTRKLAVFGTGRREFFDLESDPEERHDLVEDPSRAGEIQALTARLATHMKRIGDPAYPSLFERTS